MSRIFIAAAHKSSGKTVISTGITAALRARGSTVQTFKKGPDYIDPMWLSEASGAPCYNLDFNTMSHAELLRLFGQRATADIALIEANKGLFDGVDLKGCDSNAALAKLLKAPVVLVIDTVGMTRGIAPLMLGYQNFDPEIEIAGVILNKVGGPRHEGKLRAAMQAYCDIPVLGAVGRTADLEIGERHLGLTTPAETGEFPAMISRIARIIDGSVDLDKLIEIAGNAQALPAVSARVSTTRSKDVRIGIPRDTAFGFYYPDDLEAMENAGAELVFFDTLRDAKLPDIDGLFIGGGFPETQMVALAENVSMRANIRHAIKSGMPAYAECGGLMYLCKSLSWQGKRFDMVGAIAGDAVMNARPQGRGYARLRGKTEFPAHEFHYARIDNLPKDTKFAYEVLRGHGIDGQHDGVMLNNLTAGFCHLRHTKSNPWASQFVDTVRAKKMPR
ncbi:MAG: cobyrinate a,c-diamide synthase [Rhodobacteraceae bacterium]|nr:cobyrinate a,c-diamide synthase [Paracoccaceae bacterium]